MPVTPRSRVPVESVQTDLQSKLIEPNGLQLQIMRNNSENFLEGGDSSLLFFYRYFAIIV